MEENNKQDNNTNSSLYSSSLYGTDSKPQTAELEHSAVYGQADGKVSEEPKMTDVSENESGDKLHDKVQVSLEKPVPTKAQTIQEIQSGQSYQSGAAQPSGGNAQGFYGQPVNLNQMNGNQPDYNGQPVNSNPMNLNQINGNQTGYTSQPVNQNQMNGNQPGYNGQPVNQGQMNYNGQPMNQGQMNYNGQPVNQGQMNYNMQPIYNGQPMNAQPKKSRTGLIAGIAVAAAVVIVVAVGVLFSRSLVSSPKKQLAKGMANMTKEMGAYSSSISDDIGIEELGKLRKNQPVHTNIDLSFTDPNASGSFDNVSVELDSISDTKNKRGKYDVSIGTYGFDMEIGSIVADSNILYFSSPLVFKDDVYSLGLTNLGRDFNNSAWADLLDSTLPDDYTLTLFGENADSSDLDAQDVLEIGRIFEKYAKDTENSIKYAAIKEKREFPYGGDWTEYGGVQVTVDKEAYNEAMENMKNDILASDFYASYLEQYKMTYGSDFDTFKSEFDSAIEQIMGIRFEQDVVLNFYMDKIGRIINISTPEDIAVSSLYAEIDSIAVDIDFGGDERTLDAIEGGIYMQSGEEILYLGVSRTARITDDFYSEDFTLRLQSDSSNDEITFYYGNDWGYTDKTYDMTISIEAAGETISLTADGGYEDIVKGEGYTFRVNNAALAMDDENLLLMSGVISMEPAKDSKIEVPENAIDILEMSESDIMSALYKAVYSLQ